MYVWLNSDAESFSAASGENNTQNNLFSLSSCLQIVFFLRHSNRERENYKGKLTVGRLKAL